jgi:hypothetical protein
MTQKTETAVCRWCKSMLHPPTNDYPFWSDGLKYLGRICQYNPDGSEHEPAPAVPQTQEAELTIDDLCLCEVKTKDSFHDDKCPVLVPADPPIPRVERLEKALREFLEHLELKIGCCIVTEVQKTKLRVALEDK